MSEKHDGGPAFSRPFVPDTKQPEAPYDLGDNGMSLRDYFAAKAMHAELNTAGMAKAAANALNEAAAEAGRTPEQQIAFNAYKLADAMLEERIRDN